MNKSVRNTNENIAGNNACGANPYTCLEHPSKLATHQLIGSECTDFLLYCEKCSIMLASQGFNVRRIGGRKIGTRDTADCGNRMEVSVRKHEIEEFVGELEEGLEQLMIKDNMLQDFLVRSQAEHGALIEVVNGFYRELEEIVQLQKYITYNTILNKRAAREADARLLKTSLQASITETATMLEDINNNLDAVESVEHHVYATIMSGYREKLMAAGELMREEVRLQLPRLEINVPEVPKMLYSLADRISVGCASRKSSIRTSTITPLHMKAQQIVTEQYSIESEEKQSEVNESETESRILLQQSNLIKSSNMGELGFSFESQTNSKPEEYQNHYLVQPQFKIHEVDEEAESEGMLPVMRNSNQSSSQEMSRIQVKDRTIESRESIGAYLAIVDESRDKFAEHNETDTLLIS